MTTFNQWFKNADMPEKDKDGRWFDLEDGIYFDSCNTEIKKTTKEKHPDQGMKVIDLIDKANRLIAGQKIALERSSDQECIEAAKEFIINADKMLAGKPKKSDLLALITRNSDISRMFNNAKLRA